MLLFYPLFVTRTYELFKSVGCNFIHNNNRMLDVTYCSLKIMKRPKDAVY